MQPIIFLHGAIGAEDQLQPLRDHFSKNNFATYSFSFSGHGKIPFRDKFGIEQFSDELKKFILENALEKPHIFGYSMGGYVALYLAAKDPELFGTVITLGTKFNWSKETAEKEIKMLDPKAIEEKVPRFATALQQRHGEEWKLLLQRTSEMMLSLGNDNLLSETAVKQITTPVIIGLADHDNMVTFEETVNVYRQLQNASFFVLANTRHPIETVDAAMLYNVVSRFLS
jgi:pimeloyl-ACP methyl ester carboxylesterase